MGWGYLAMKYFHLAPMATQVDLVLAGGIGVLMGALILPWIRGRPATCKSAALLGLMTLVVAAPLFVTVLISDEPNVHPGWGLVYFWAMIVLFALTTHLGGLVLMAFFTVFGLWTWLNRQERQRGFL